MRRYWIDPSCRNLDAVTIEGEAFHHIFDVCRQNVGDKFEVLFGDNKAYLVEVKSVGKKTAEAEIKSSREVAALPQPFLKLFIAIPRMNIFDAVLEKCVELGVYSVTPLFSEHSFFKENDGVSENRFERWKKIIRSATQQSGRGELMTLTEPQSLASALKAFNQNYDSLGLFLYEGETTLDIKEWSQKQPEKPKEIWVFVGSEGGFSSVEVQKFQEFKLSPVTLGPQVLRVETACVAVLSVLKYHWSLMGNR